MGAEKNSVNGIGEQHVYGPATNNFYYNDPEETGRKSFPDVCINIRDKECNNDASWKRLTFLGRKKEWEWIDDFLDSDGMMKVGAVVGGAGIGKTKMIYEYMHIRHKACSQWAFIFTTWPVLKNWKIQNLPFEKDVFLVLDYVLAYTDEIGEWLAKLSDKGVEKKLRILILERACVAGDNIPLWYSSMIEKYGLERKCFDSRDIWNLETLSDEELIRLGKEYLDINHVTYENEEYEAYMWKFFQENHLNQKSKLKRPLFILYMARAWAEAERISDESSILDYIYKKEHIRIKKVWKEERYTGDLFEKVLAFSMATSELDLMDSDSMDSAPEFIRNGVQTMKDMCGKNGILLRSVLLEFKSFDEDSLLIGEDLPDIVKEYYCVKYLRSLQYDRGEKGQVDEFIDAAWRYRPRMFFQFLCRTAEDGQAWKFADLDGIFRWPCGLDKENYETYGDVLREFTFQRKKVNSNKIMERFEKMLAELDREKERKLFEAVLECYEISLYNIWSGFFQQNGAKILNDVDMGKVRHKFVHLTEYYEMSERAQRASKSIDDIFNYIWICSNRSESQ